MPIPFIILGQKPGLRAPGAPGRSEGRYGATHAATRPANWHAAPNRTSGCKLQPDGQVTVGGEKYQVGMGYAGTAVTMRLDGHLMHAIADAPRPAPGPAWLRRRASCGPGRGQHWPGAGGVSRRRPRAGCYGVTRIFSALRASIAA